MTQQIIGQISVDDALVSLLRGPHGGLLLDVQIDTDEGETIDLDKNKELHGIWNWDLMQFDMPTVMELVDAAKGYVLVS